MQSKKISAMSDSMIAIAAGRNLAIFINIITIIVFLYSQINTCFRLGKHYNYKFSAERKYNIIKVIQSNQSIHFSIESWFIKQIFQN